MKAVVVFVLLFATVLCRPARKVTLSSSESSEEVMQRPAVSKQALLAPQTRSGPLQSVAAESDESAESSEEDAEVPAQVKAGIVEPTSATDTSSVSEDSDDDDDDETEESETEEEEDDDESSDSSDSESGESSTATPTDAPVVVTDEPLPETTEEPIEPTVVTDPDARGDSLGGSPSDYKSVIYVEDKSYHKVPVPYKSYEYLGKKSAYDMTDGNEVEKSLKVYKVQALQVHADLLEEDTSTPEVESQGLDVSQDQDARQASVPAEEEESAGTSEPTTSESESASTPEEEEEEEEEEESTSTASDSASTSQEEEDEESQSSEEATATPGAADNDDSDESESTESDSDEAAGTDTATDAPVVITAK